MSHIVDRGNINYQEKYTQPQMRLILTYSKEYNNAEQELVS